MCAHVFLEGTDYLISLSVVEINLQLKCRCHEDVQHLYLLPPLLFLIEILLYPFHVLFPVVSVIYCALYPIARRDFYVYALSCTLQKGHSAENMSTSLPADVVHSS